MLCYCTVQYSTAVLYLLYSKVNQLYIYIYPFPLQLPSHPQISHFC